MRANSSAAAFNCWPSLSHCHKYVVAKKTYDCDEHLLLSSMLYSSLTAKGAAGALLDEAGVASVRSFQIEAGKGAGVGAASASLNKVLVEVVGVVLLVTKNGLHASDELIVVVVIKKGFAVVTVCEASTEAVEAAAAATAGAVARVAEDTLLDLVVDATNACQTGPRTFGTTAAAVAATAIVVSLVSKVCKTRFLPPCSCLLACHPACLPV